MVNSTLNLSGVRLTHQQSDVYVMYNWNLWSSAVIRTERAKIQDLPNDLRLVGYLCRLKFAWQVHLRIDELDGRPFAVVASFLLKDAAPDGWWEIGRRDASAEIGRWLEAQDSAAKISTVVELKEAA